MKIYNYIILYPFVILLHLVTYSYADSNKTSSYLNFDNFHVQSNSLTKNANFADHYLIKVYGCGGGAICGEIKNLITHEVIGLPNAYLIEDEVGKNEFSIEYHLDSSLIIISGIIADPNENQDKEGYRKRYYNFINDKLELISSIEDD